MDKEAKAVVENFARQYNENLATLSKLDAKEKLAMTREGYEGLVTMAGEPEEVYAIENKEIVGVDGNNIPIRLYRPTANNDLPVLFYIHGGGFTAGSLDTHDRPLRALANRSGFLVAALQYRLAPEHPFPEGLNDCYAVLQWLSQNTKALRTDGTKIVIAGDSAGGNLATVTAMMARDRNGPRIQRQILIYPNTDLTLDSTSWQELGTKGYVLTRSDMASNIAMYVSDNRTLAEAYLSPLKAENLQDLPDAVVVTGGFDPLHTEGEQYANRLRASEVTVAHWHYPGQIHGFLQLGAAIPQGDELISRIAEYLKIWNKN